VNFEANRLIQANSVLVLWLGRSSIRRLSRIRRNSRTTDDIN